MKPREIMVWVCMSYHGKPYVWGGDDPEGFDCSGLAIEGLMAAGRFPRDQDTTAHGLMKKYVHIGREEVQPGCLVFWVNSSGHAYHVAVAVGKDHYIGAEGGGSWAVQREGESDEAFRSRLYARNAFIKIRPIDSRGSHANRRYADPFR